MGWQRQVGGGGGGGGWTGFVAAMDTDPVSDGSEIGVIANINENRRLSMMVNLLGSEEEAMVVFGLGVSFR